MWWFFSIHVVFLVLLMMREMAFDPGMSGRFDLAVLCALTPCHSCMFVCLFVPPLPANLDCSHKLAASAWKHRGPARKDILMMPCSAAAAAAAAEPHRAAAEAEAAKHIRRRSSKEEYKSSTICSGKWEKKSTAAGEARITHLAGPPRCCL